MLEVQMDEVIYELDPFGSTSEFLAVEQSAGEATADLNPLTHFIISENNHDHK